MKRIITLISMQIVIFHLNFSEVVCECKSKMVYIMKENVYLNVRTTLISSTG